MTKLSTHIALLFFSSLLLLANYSCEFKDEPDVKANLYARYDQEAKILKAEATFFKEGENSGSMVFQGGVALLGSGMETKELPGNIVRYEIERQIETMESLPFTFKDEGGKQQSFTASMFPIPFFSVKEGGLNRAKGGFVVFQGKPLESTESLVLIFSDIQNKSLRLERKGPAEQPEIIIGPGELTGLTAGEVQLYLVRIRKEVQQKGKTTATLTTEYYTDSKPVLVSE